jgi:hypothetical protein
MGFPYLLLNSKGFYRLCCAAQPLIWDGRSAAFAIAVPQAKTGADSKPAKTASKQAIAAKV